jgi:hypothetical protein
MSDAEAKANKKVARALFDMHLERELEAPSSSTEVQKPYDFKPKGKRTGRTTR